jgi:hypothetical protein
MFIFFIRVFDDKTRIFIYKLKLCLFIGLKDDESYHLEEGIYFNTTTNILVEVYMSAKVYSLFIILPLFTFSFSQSFANLKALAMFEQKPNFNSDTTLSTQPIWTSGREDQTQNCLRSGTCKD